MYLDTSTGFVEYVDGAAGGMSGLLLQGGDDLEEEKEKHDEGRLIWPCGRPDGRRREAMAVKMECWPRHYLDRQPGIELFDALGSTYCLSL